MIRSCCPAPSANRLPFIILLVMMFGPGLAGGKAHGCAQFRDATGGAREPRALEQLEYAESFFPDIEFDADMTPPDAMLAHPLGKHPATQDEIDRCLSTWADESSRAVRMTYATSHQGRALSYLIVSSPDNISRLDSIAEAQQRLADRRSFDRESAAASLLERTPGIVWLGYGIHGDEASGSDAAIATAWYLTAGRSNFIDQLLDDTVILIDPSLNPDGRARFLNDIRQSLSSVPEVDDQSRMNRDRWPSGRMNHYLFDLNRDWVFATQPETVGRIEVFNRWYPQLFIDAHEIWSQTTYFFTPSVEPINPHYPEFGRRWWDVFAEDHADAFDAAGWRYYTADIFDDWYPGYSNSWAAYRGSIGILYEQAGVIWHGIARPEGRVLTYRQSVHQQLTSTLANLQTFHEHSDKIKAEWLTARRAAMSEDSAYASRAWVLQPSGDNMSRWQRLLDLLQLQNVEVHVADRGFIASGMDRFGREVREHHFPEGAYIIFNRQPEAHLVAALLEFDTRFSPDFLTEEREEIVRRGGSRVYDITAWSLPMLFDIPAWEISLPEQPASTLVEAGVAQQDNRATARVRTARATEPAHAHAHAPGVSDRQPRQGWVVRGGDDAIPALAVKLGQRGVRVRIALRDFSWDDVSFPRGSLVIAREDHMHLRDESHIDTLDRLTAAAGVTAHAISTGHGRGEMHDLGGRYFPLLHDARLAIVGGDGTDPYDFGSIWHLIDHRHALPATYLDLQDVARSDLDRYDVIVLPSATSDADRALLDWADRGGTLIATGSSAVRLAGNDASSALRLRVNLLRNVLDDIEDYQLAILREILSPATPSMEAIYAEHVEQATPEFPWSGLDLGMPGLSSDEVQRRDAWQRQFRSNGAILAARTDREHWLTLGLRPETPLLAPRGSNVLMAASGVDAPVRYGIVEDNVAERVMSERAKPESVETPDASEKRAAESVNSVSDASSKNGHESDTDAAKRNDDEEEDGAEQEKSEARFGWAVLPENRAVRLRMSGLIWPETAQRIANSAAVTREKHGGGQVILIAGPPAFRGASPVTERVLLNAIAFGPSLGAPPSLRIRP